MKFLIFSVLFAVLALAFSEEEVSSEENVLVLSKDNFDSVISGNDYVLVEFYAPWCGHCKSLAPEYAKAATQLSGEGSAIKLAKVDATQEQELAEKFGVRGYPTLKFFRNGSPSDYNGGRQADDIVAWVKKKSGPPATEVSSVADAKELVESNNVLVIGFFKDLESEDAKKFTSLAALIDQQPFAITSNEEVFKEYSAECGNVILFKKFDEGQVKYDGELEEVSFKKWVFIQSLPIIVEFSHETASKIFGGEIKNHILIFLSKKNGDFEKYISEFKPVAEQYRSKILFVSIDTDEDDHQRILEFFGMKKEEVPAMRLIGLEEDMAKYKPEKPDLSTANIEDFVSNFFEGKLKQHLLSDDLPEDWNANPVKVLVATNFDSVVFDAEKKVLVEFYAPWCGHCKQLAPIYDKLGEHFESDDSVVIAKMDATTNELEHTKISSFPTIKLYNKDNQALDYNGERTLDALIKFVESDGEAAHATPDVSEEESEEDTQKKDEL